MEFATLWLVCVKNMPWSIQIQLIGGLITKILGKNWSIWLVVEI